MGKKNKGKKKKKWKDEEEEKQDQSGKSPAGTYADGHPLHQIQYLEAKLILKPETLTDYYGLLWPQSRSADARCPRSPSA